jgi:hypothetical protein
VGWEDLRGPEAPTWGEEAMRVADGARRPLAVAGAAVVGLALPAAASAASTNLGDVTFGSMAVDDSGQHVRQRALGAGVVGSTDVLTGRLPPVPAPKKSQRTRGKA